MANRKGRKGQTTIYIALHRKLKNRTNNWGYIYFQTQKNTQPPSFSPDKIMAAS
jgi:hypothetical protein